MKNIISKLTQWFFNNETNTVSVYFTSRKKETEHSQLLRIGGQPIQQVPSVKLLDSHTDCDLSWSTHVDNLCS